MQILTIACDLIYKSEKDDVEYYSSINENFLNLQIWFIPLSQQFFFGLRKEKAAVYCWIWTLCARRGWVADTIPRSLYPYGKAQYLFYRKLSGPQNWAGQVRKPLSLPVFKPRTVHPVAILYLRLLSLKKCILKTNSCHRNRTETCNSP